MTDDLVKRAKEACGHDGGPELIDLICDLVDRIEALTADFALQVQRTDEQREAYEQALSVMEADNERLREALERIASYLSEPAGEADEEDTMNSLRGDLRFVGRTTRAALNGKDSE